MRLRRLLGFRDGDDMVPEAASLPHLGAALSVVALLAENPDTGIRLSRRAKRSNSDKGFTPSSQKRRARRSVRIGVVGAPQEGHR